MEGKIMPTTGKALVFEKDFNTHAGKMASEEELGHVRVDGKTIKINDEGVISGSTTIEVENSLDSESPDDALSANQGKVLKELIDTKVDKNTIASGTQDGLMSIEQWNKLNNIQENTKNTTVSDRLDNDSPTEALSAGKGKELNDNLTTLQTLITNQGILNTVLLDRNIDLNTVIKPGNYTLASIGFNARNLPFNGAFNLEVSGYNTFPTQIATIAYGTDKKFRVKTSKTADTWSD